jgi:hypothetical protein
VGQLVSEELRFDVFVVSAFRAWVFCFEASWPWRGLGWQDEAEGLCKWYVNPEGSVLQGGACMEWAVSPLCDVEAYGGVDSVDWSSGLAGIAGCCGIPVGVL